MPDVQVVGAYLKELGFPAASIYSPLSGTQRYCEELNPPPDKNAFLAHIAAEREVASAEVALFDDDRRNVAAAVASGHRGSAVAPGEGMSVDAFLLYLEKAGT